MKRISRVTIFASVLILSLICAQADVSRATSISAGVDDGYSARVLDKVLKIINPAAILRGQSGISLELFVDGDGKYAKSVIRDSSGLKSVDDEFIAALKKASPFGQPPYGQPTGLTLTFKNDNGSAKNAAANQEGGQKTDAAKNVAPDNAARQKYMNAITREIRNSVYIPAEAKKGTYSPTALVKLDKQGAILSYAIAKSSGDKTVDKYLLQGIKRKGKVSAPPAGVGNEFELTFKLTR